MVTALKTENGTQFLSANLQKTIQSIREIVGNHSDSEIYNALKESNMDPNETAQKLLNQDPFHEVRRRRDKKKENAGFNSYIDQRNRGEYRSQGSRFYGSERNARRVLYTRTPVHDAGISQEFRVVRDKRVNQNSDTETKVSSEVSSSANVPRSNNVSEKSPSVFSYNQRHDGARHVQTLNGGADVRPKPARDVNFNVRKDHSEERKSIATVSLSQISVMKSIDSQSQLGSQTSSSAVGVYASASDPVHVPSPDSRSSAAVGAIRRGVGVVGGRRHSSEITLKQSFQQNVCNLKSVLGSCSNTESVRPVNSFSGNDESHSTVVDSVMISSTGIRLVNHFSGRSQQQTVGHHKGFLSSKEWKPKTSQKSNVSSPGVIGSPVKSASKMGDDSDNVDKEADCLERKLSQVNVRESENVIIAEHIRVPENDRCRLMFGSFGMESDDVEHSSSRLAAPKNNVEDLQQPSPSCEQLSPVDDQVRNCDSSTPFGAEFESQLPDNKHSSDVSGTENCTDMGLAPNSPLTASKTQQQQDAAEFPTVSAYEPQPVYDMPYFKPSIDDAVGGPGLPSLQETLSPHAANNIHGSSMAMMRQQVPVAQMYPQFHLSHFANVMPYRQFLPPVYVSPVVPGYSGNPAYPHLSNGSSYVLMPGGSSHLTPNGLKYGVQQFKPLPGSTPTGYGNFGNPAYAINAPGVVGGPTGTDDSSRLKYKDSNLYVPNPQAETSEIWMQNHRELAGMQSTPYFNMQGQTGHPAYLQSHPGHASFNAAAAAQSSHMQFPGMYPPQPAAIPSPHHLGGSNIGVGVAPAPGGQIGAYQQAPQIGHLNWSTNF